MPTPERRIPSLTEENKINFWKKLDRNGPIQPHMETPCWDWTAGKFSHGYGSFSIGRRGFLAHRVAYFIHYGVDPVGLCVCHHCDRRSCCNPAHHFLGTNLNNVMDRTSKGRDARGEQHGSRTRPERRPRGEAVNFSKLTATDIPVIRADCRARSKIASDYGVNQTTIERIKSRKTWKHVN